MIDLGLCSTPMSYYANGLLGADAQHHDHRLAQSRRVERLQAVPRAGHPDQRRHRHPGHRAHRRAPALSRRRPRTPGTVTHARHRRRTTSRTSATFADIRRPLKIAVDFANAMGIVEGKVLRRPASRSTRSSTRSTAPSRTTRPTRSSPTRWRRSSEASAPASYDFGVAFDGDADRVGLRRREGRHHPDGHDHRADRADDPAARKRAPIFYDLRSSWAVKEVIEENGGTPMMSRVGHAFIKQQMRDAKAIFAGELSGHYYFRDNYFAESSALAALCVANLVSAVRQAALRAHQADPALLRQRRDQLRGRTTSRPSSSACAKKYAERHGDRARRPQRRVRRLVVQRPRSNTEPLVRLNLEAKTAADHGAAAATNCWP